MKQIEKILVPIDFSEISERNIELARLMAEQNNAEIIVLFVVEDVFAYSGFATNEVPFFETDPEILEKSKRRLNEFADKHLAHSSVTYRTQVIQGHAAQVIIDFSKSNAIDLITMGTHGYRGLEKVFLGSVTDRVLKLATCPVLTSR